MQADRISDAVAEFKKVLMTNGSHVETMKELLSIYEVQDDKANIKKYKEKIALIEAAQEEEHAKQVEETQKENKKLEEQEPAPIAKENRESFDTGIVDEYEASDKRELSEEEQQYIDRQAESDADASEPLSADPASGIKKGLRKVMKTKKK